MKELKRQAGEWLKHSMGRGQGNEHQNRSLRVESGKRNQKGLLEKVQPGND